VPEGALQVIGNPLDLGEFADSQHRGEFRRRCRIGTEPIVLFLGKITPRKNVDALVQAFAQLPHNNARLVIAGNDMGGGSTARRLAAELGVAERTHFTGLLTGSTRIEALADADVVVYASEHEIFGLVPFEALLAGTPVVVADDSGCGELVGQTGGAVVVPVNDPPALALGINQVLAQPSIWRMRARQAAEHVRMRYSSEVVCEALEAVYCDIVPSFQEAISA
jgi:glycosyltransferase involved in cell wall biosynthesis